MSLPLGDWVDLDSSWLARVRYLEDLAELHVETKRGDRYCYDGVPIHTYARLLKASSPGRMFNDEIRDSYRWGPM